MRRPSAVMPVLISTGFMRRLLAITPWVLAIGLLIAGGWFLTKASHAGGWGAAAPALLGLACLIAAAALVGRRLVRPLTGMFGQMFYPQSYFTAPPESLLTSLRGRLAEGRIGLVEHQVKELLKAYPHAAGLYHVWALVEAAKGRSVQRVTAEASRALSSSVFAEYEAMLHAMPPHKGSLPPSNYGHRMEEG